uniref:Uncharacterized protein n=1 Tax=viral metagenome TaxID=1070528 RepID=A0A6M3J9G2_9ZZZZ
MVLWWRPGHGDGDIPSGVDYSGIFSTRDSTLSLIRYDDTNNRFQAYDSANSAYFPTFTAVRDTWYKLVLQFGYLTSNVGKMRLGLDGGSGVSYSTASNYDGAFDVTGSLLRVGYGATAPFHIRAIAIYPDKILTDTFINAGGSP